MNNNKGKSNNAPNLMWVYAIVLASILGIAMFGSSTTESKEISISKLITLIQNGEVKDIRVNKSGGPAEIYLTNEAKKKDEHKRKGNSMFLLNQSNYTYTFGTLENFEKEMLPFAKENKVDIKYESEGIFTTLLLNILPFILIFGLMWFFIFRRMGAGGAGAGSQIFNIGKSRAQLFDGKKNTKVTFKDVAGLEGAKEEVQEIVDFLKSPQKYTKLGGKIPKGALLVGPPGTGKTLLAKAVAGEADVPFFSLSGSDFVEMFVGVGASRVRDLFKDAKSKSPSIIFIDEIDAIGRARGKSNITGGNDERENTLNQLLTEMDGFGTESNVIVMAATNRADVLDKALMRAGRFDRRIYVDLPDLNERKAIFEVHLKALKLGSDIEIDFLAKQTPGFSGADIANVCNEAALVAARKSKEAVEKQDFLDAVDRIIGGLEKKNKIIKPHEKKRIAFHEAGHATTSWLLEHAAPLVKVTIVPRGQSLGAAWYLPEERQITTTEQILDEMCTALGGRAAEQVIFGNISTGALSDLEKVTKQAQAMVAIYGLDDKIGNRSYYDSSGQQSGFTKPYSEETAQVIDNQVSKIIEEQYLRAIEILKNNQDKLTQLAEVLLDREVIFRDDLLKIFGDRPFEDEEETEKKNDQNSDSNIESTVI
ncbi:MAG: ATP-dependent zinc metalloprotease FtsH [Flavobacteriales bacterium]